MTAGLQRGRTVRVAVLAATVAALVAAAAAVGMTGAEPLTQSSVLLVVTDKGAIRGAVRAGMRSFLGIPYAAAPVGDLRWRPPRSHPAWTGVRAARAFGSPCPQNGSWFGNRGTNEDCLFLNVFTPPSANAGTGYPVMVWIHGGGLLTGASSNYLPDGLVARKVVVVTVDYRLGVLGFLAHPSLAAESPAHASGDYGLMDQQFALRWVRQNIARFGGDPRNVTLFGQSAGGLSVHAQLASPGAHGLFQRAIVESGGYAGTQPSLPAAEAAGAAFAASAGCGAQTAVCLRRLPVATLLDDQPRLDVTPVIDGKLLTRSITDAFTSGRFNRVPVIEGSTHDEYRFFLATDEPPGGLLTASRYRAAIATTLAVTPTTAARVAALYPLSGFPSPSIALGAVGTDALFACRARAAAQALSRYVPTFQYEFNDDDAPLFVPPPPPGFPLGAFHTAELQYLFTLPSFPERLAGDHEALSEAMRDLWTTFAKTGNPGSGWPRYSTTSARVESLAPPRPATETGFSTDHRCAFWDKTPTATP